MSRPDDSEPRDGAADDVLDEEPEPEPESEPEWMRLRRLDAVFGKGVEGRGEQHGGKGDAWYRDQTPPHHG